MLSDDLFRMLDRNPFPILRLHLVGGLEFELRDPDAVVLSQDSIEFLLPSDGSNLREAVVNLAQIVWVEVITPRVE